MAQLPLILLGSAGGVVVTIAVVFALARAAWSGEQRRVRRLPNSRIDIR